MVVSGEGGSNTTGKATCMPKADTGLAVWDDGQVGFLKPNGFLANVLLTLFID